MDLVCIIPAAGSGKRMNYHIPKQFLRVKEKYILEYTIGKICNFSPVTEIVLVINGRIKSKTCRLVEEKKFDKVKKIVIGGESRAKSVLNGLNNVPSKYSWVLVHDGARPLVSQNILSNCVNLVQKDSSLDGAITGIPLKSTIKKVNIDNKIVDGTLQREKLQKIQTPQIVRKEKLIEAYKEISESKLDQYTDESHLLENIGAKIKVIKGEEKNFKVTTAIDLKKVEFFLNHSEIDNHSQNSIKPED